MIFVFSVAKETDGALPGEPRRPLLPTVTARGKQSPKGLCLHSKAKQRAASPSSTPALPDHRKLDGDSTSRAAAFLKPALQRLARHPVAQRERREIV